MAEDPLLIRRFGEYGSLDQVNVELAQITDKYNRRPRREFQGLSPVQIARLLYSEWNTPDSPLQLNRHLPEKRFIRAPILRKARVFLNAISSTPAKATASGNLNRKFVAQTLQEMTWPDGYLDEIHRFNKVINEEDAWSLHILRIVLQQAGLIRKYKGSFRTTKMGDNCRKEAKANELYLSLFLSYFRKFNLAYLDRCQPCPSVQQTLAYSLYVLSTHAGKWTDVKGLSNDVFLPMIREELDTGPDWDYRPIILEKRIVEPLESFGLLECQREKGEYRLKLQRVRTALLFSDFITFDN